MRTSTFNTIGTDVSTYSSSADVLSAAGLDYNVIKRPIYYSEVENPEDNSSFKCYKDRMITLNESTQKPFGVVSSKYEICQNRDAFSFIDYIGNDCDTFEYVKAGETDKGLVYIIAKIGNVSILGDEVTPYIIFQNSHDGLGSVKATISPLRIVCQNQFNVSFKQSPNTVRIIHSNQMDSKLITARTTMKEIAEYMNSFEGTAESLATKKVGTDKVIQIFNEVFKYSPEKMTNKQVQNFETSRAEFVNCYLADDNANFKGTAWGVMNGAADYLTHKTTVRKTSPEAMFVNTTLLSTVLTQIYNRIAA